MTFYKANIFAHDFNSRQISISYWTCFTSLGFQLLLVSSKQNGVADGQTVHWENCDCRLNWVK